MKILVLGGSGMLGHKMVQVIAEKHKVFYTTRLPLAETIREQLNDSIELSNFNALNAQEVVNVIKASDFDAVINCIGVVKQLTDSSSVLNIQLNSLLPHVIADVCKSEGVRFIHISTDCVFSGKKGNYVEGEDEDAQDLYGRSKLLGEVTEPSLTLRTSIIGHELNTNHSLVDWFLNQSENVNGYANAIYSGVSTIQLAKIVLLIIEKHENMCGLYHVASKPINKFSLLGLIKDKYNHTITINKYLDFINDKSMISERFEKYTGYKVPDWNQIVDEMHQDYINKKKLYRK
jgi:dTDP-4-dehydrorhamnose reductase